MAQPDRTEQTTLIAFSSLLCFSILYIFRFLDDNTLTSWRWIFVPEGFQTVFLLIAISIPLSLITARHLAFEKKPLLTIAMLAGATVLPLWSEPELLLDSGRYFLQAKHVSEYGPLHFLREWGRSIPAWTDMPLIPFCYGLIFKLFGETRAAIQWFNTIVFALAMLSTFLLGREIWHAEIGVFGALLLLGIPYLPTQVPLMLVDIHAMFLLTLSVWLFLKATRHGGTRRIILCSFAVTSAILTKYSILPMLTILPLITLLSCREQGMIAVRRSLAVAVIVAGLLIGPTVFYADILADQMEKLLGFQRQGLSMWREGYISTFFFQIHPFVTLLALYAVYQAGRKKDSRFLITGSFLFLMILLHIQRIRYLLPLLPLFTLMASCGLCTIKDAQVKRFLCCMIIFYSLSVLYGACFPFFRTTSMMNIREAGRYLDTIEADTVEVWVGPQEMSAASTAMAIPQLDIFTRKKLIARNWPSGAESPSGYFSLRFTWEIAQPAFYRAETESSFPQVFIFGGTNKENIPVAMQGRPPTPADREFFRQSEVFRYKTLVIVRR